MRPGTSHRRSAPMARVRCRCCWKVKSGSRLAAFPATGGCWLIVRSSPTAITIFGPCHSIPAIRSTLNRVSRCRSSERRRWSRVSSSLPTTDMLPTFQMSPEGTRFTCGRLRDRMANQGRRGVYPEWSPNGRELFYRGFDNRIWVTDYTVTKGGSFSPRQIPHMVRPPDPARRDPSELRPRSRRQALRGVPDARSDGQGQGPGPRNLPAEFLRRTAPKSAGGEITHLTKNSGLPIFASTATSKNPIIISSQLCCP